MTNPIRVGVFFGGHSREREISFAGGRTVYDHLDRTFFEPIPIFVDSLGNFILLEWRYLYQSTIREFYPRITDIFEIPLYIESLEPLHAVRQQEFIATIGKPLAPVDFLEYFDFVFLCLHGPYGEDGTIQGLLEWYQIPYSGAGVLPSALAINKVFQRKFFHDAGFVLPQSLTFTYNEWKHISDRQGFFDQAVALLGLPLVVKSSLQGSSIGVHIVESRELTSFITALHQAFFIEEISYARWKSYGLEDKKTWLTNLTDIREGIGFPLSIGKQVFYKPSLLLEHIECHFAASTQPILLVSERAEQEIMLESFVEGREFSCIVLESKSGHPIALPPTEMLKGDLHFDYRAKYLPGIVRKVTPIALDSDLLEKIEQKVLALFCLLRGQVYARIDGFITKDEQIILNDPNTTAGMNPSSFLFHQAAEIGLNPTQLLTFIIKRSLEARIEEYQGHLVAQSLLERLLHPCLD